MRITWWGHSTTTIEENGTRLLTDPVLTSRIAHVRRRRGPAPAPEAGQCDAVLVSHLHADHLHLTSLPLISPDAALVVPRGAAKLIHADSGASYSDRCIEVAPGHQLRIGALDLTVVTADHDGRRLPWSAHRGPALGFRVEGSPSVWFAGDTDLYDDLAAEAGPVDLALVPVGGWGPSLGPGHLDPVRAAEAVRRVGARIAVPVHFGTFWPIGCDRLKPELFLPPGDRFREAMAEVNPAVKVELLAPGESTEVVRP
ncbi:MBL fold metallo-hydrolase [Kribbella sp. CA-293567]|uniref:MBL fold metallo-hydrolase n=1 Tax=Kribbella sp. CA-293567 TaxID=3002436 RepID=UPI0022DD90CB|nr:MBL fold metallo-hydrolase [Kribbella sp. CA-293567]WBQ02424.1 MBL fold metallo-hydrolase [Kribbella sp. CA-293567]